MKLLQIATFSFCILFASATACAEELRNYAYAWPLTLEGDAAAWQIEPTVEVYAAISDRRLRDIEVVDGEGNPVPMALRGTDFTRAAATSIELPLFALPTQVNPKADEGAVNLRIERDADGRLRSLDAGVNPGAASAAASADFIVDASTLDAPIDSLRVDWNETSDAVNAQFAISGSDDLQTWHDINTNASVLALTQGGNQLSRHEIATQGARAKYLRLHRLDAGAVLNGLRINARMLAPSTPVRAARQWIVASPVINDDIAAPAGSAIYRYDLAAALPVEALKLELGSDNSIATVQIASRDAEGAIWSQHANFTAFRLHQGERVIDNDAIQLDASTPSRRWFVRATPPLDRAPDLRVAWRPQRFVFLAQGHGPYRLIAGSATARRADYPIDIALAELRSRLGNDWQPPLAQLGARATLAGATALAAPPPQTERDWKTGLLWAVLVAAAGLIGALALSLLRQPKT